MSFLFDYYNASVVDGRVERQTPMVEHTLKNDGYDAARAIPYVDDLLDSEK